MRVCRVLGCVFVGRVSSLMTVRLFNDVMGSLVFTIVRVGKLGRVGVLN